MLTELVTRCLRCREETSLPVQSADLAAFRGGMFAEVAFHYLSPEDLRLITHQHCHPCFNELFPTGNT